MVLYHAAVIVVSRHQLHSVRVNTNPKRCLVCIRGLEADAHLCRQTRLFQPVSQCAARTKSHILYRHTTPDVCVCCCMRTVLMLDINRTVTHKISRNTSLPSPRPSKHTYFPRFAMFYQAHLRTSVSSDNAASSRVGPPSTPIKNGSCGGSLSQLLCGKNQLLSVWPWPY